jgi:hypothetical protein
MRTYAFFLLVTVLLVFTSCAKEDKNTELGGDTDIALTKVDSVSGVSIRYNNEYIGFTEMKVISNVKGDVTYKAKMDLHTLSDDLKLKALDLLPKIKDYYDVANLKITPDQKIEFDFKLKITSEGYMDYFTEGKPWVMAKYGDGVGTEYAIKNNKGQVLSRKVTEKTGIDEWPFGFYLIKTSLIEHVPPADNPVFNKISYRVNHKFGLVFIDFELKDGTKLGINIFAWFV